MHQRFESNGVRTETEKEPNNKKRRTIVHIIIILLLLFALLKFVLLFLRFLLHFENLKNEQCTISNGAVRCNKAGLKPKKEIEKNKSREIIMNETRN